MKELQDKQRLRKALYSLPALVVLALLTILLGRGAYNIMSKRAESSERLNALETETQALREREAGLQLEIDKLETDDGVVGEIRAKFNAAREGEHLAVIVEKEKPVASSTPTTLDKLKSFFGKIGALWPF